MGETDLREQGGVTYRELRSRSLLNKCVSPRMPFTWTVNPYRGCAMGCRYCYATYTHEFMGITTPEALQLTNSSPRSLISRSRGPGTRPKSVPK